MMEKTTTTNHNTEETMARLTAALTAVAGKIGYRLTQKGPGLFVDRHQIWGRVDEEVNEFKEAVHSKDLCHSADELFDIAVAAIWGIASMVEAGIGCEDCGGSGIIYSSAGAHVCHCQMPDACGKCGEICGDGCSEGIKTIQDYINEEQS